jgi:hypothetical protein
MDDTGEILPEHVSQLAFNFLLDVFLDDGDGVESAVYIDILQGICLEHQGHTFLPRNHEYNVARESKVG